METLESPLPKYLFKALDEDEFQAYFDYDDVPADEHDPDEDGDDSVLKDQPLGLPPTSEIEISTPELWLPPSAEQLLVAPRRRVVPFARDFRNGAKGKDVLAVKRALKKAGYKRVDARHSVFGNSATSALKDFQERKGLRPDGVYGKDTHERLIPFFDARGIALMAKAKEAWENKEKIGNIPHGIQACAIFQYNNRWVVQYTQSHLRMSGIRGNLHPPKIGKWEDCSSSYSWWSFDGGSIDPNGGTAYTGAGAAARPRSSPQGYTGTLIAHGRQIASHAMGAAILYGSSFSRTKHVAGGIGTKRMVVSFGSYPTKMLDFEYRGDILCWRVYWND